MGVYKDAKTKKDFSGAGVLIVEKYKSDNGKTIPCILVVMNSAAKTLSDFGGAFSAKHKKLYETARLELLEESKNLINIPAKTIKSAKQIDIDAGKRGNYKAFVIKVANISTKYFNHNSKVINAHPKSTKYWKETQTIHHIPISSIDFDNLLQRKATYFTDVRNKKIKVSMRLRKILFGSKNILLEVLNDKSIVTKKNLTKIQSSDFKNGTYSFVL